MRTIITAVIVAELAFGAVSAFAAGYKPASTGSKTVGTSAGALSATAAECRSLSIVNTHASAIVYIGASGVTTSTGVPLDPTKNPSYTWEYTGVTISPTDVYVVSAAGGEAVRWVCNY